MPADNNRLFDVWQEHRACIANPATGRAIWRVDIEREDYRLSGMTVLCLRVADLFETPPATMRGRVVPSREPPAAEADEGKAQAGESAAAPDTPQTDSQPSPASDDGLDAVPVAETLPPQADVSSIDERVDKSARRASALDKDEARSVAEEFMGWIAQGVADKRLVVNSRQAFIHGVPQGFHCRRFCFCAIASSFTTPHLLSCLRRRGICTLCDAFRPISIDPECEKATARP